MSNFNNIHDFEVGQVFVTKKGHKMEVMAVRKDKNQDGDMDTGSVEMRVFVHRDSKNCQSYGWAHNVKYFISCMRTDGGDGLLRTLQNEGWKLKD